MVRKSEVAPMALNASWVVLCAKRDEWLRLESRQQKTIDAANAELLALAAKLETSSQQIREAKRRLRAIVHVRTKLRSQRKQVEREIAYLESR